jgi:uracil-DNA glycosylase
MVARRPPPSAGDFLPAERTIPRLREAARDCRGCSLYLSATQTVFGEGPQSAHVVFVGEQPGDLEDRAGRPFVGPAGRVFNQALEAAGLERRNAYVTNAVKHFKFEERGKARLHKRPTTAEVKACHPWLQTELEAIRPRVLVLLGSTAAQALFGRHFRVTAQRGRALESSLAPLVIATAHPSSILRAPDADARHAAFEALVADLRVVARALAEKER